MSLAIYSIDDVYLSMYTNTDMNFDKNEYLEIFNNDMVQLRLSTSTPDYTHLDFLSQLDGPQSDGATTRRNAWVNEIGITPRLLDGFESGDFSRFPWVIGDGGLMMVQIHLKEVSRRTFPQMILLHLGRPEILPSL